MKLTNDDYKMLELIKEIQDREFTVEELEATIAGFLLSLDPDIEKGKSIIKVLKDKYSTTAKEIAEMMAKKETPS